MVIYKPYNGELIGYAKKTAGVGAILAGTYAGKKLLTSAYDYYNSRGNRSVGKASSGPSKYRARRRPINKKRQRIRPVKLAKEVVRLNNKVSALAKESKNCHSVLDYHLRGSGRILSSVNSMNFASVGSNAVANYESVLGQLRFFNPSTPGTLTTVDGSTGTYAREYYFKSVYARIDVVNNYQIPVKMRLYCLTPRTDTSTDPATSFTNGLSDAGNPSSTSPAMFPSDSKEFSDTWNIVKSSAKVLQPGSSITMTWTAQDVYYEPQIYDSINSSYQKRFKCQVFAIRLEGPLGHDTSANQQSLLQAGLDYVLHYKWVCHYDNGGTPIKFIYISDSCPTSFTNGGVMSERPIADNIGYSVA